MMKILYLKKDITISRMWLMPGSPSGRKTSAPILFINTLEKDCYELEVQPYWKTGL